MKITLDFDDSIIRDFSETDLKMYCAVGLYEKGLMTTGALSKMVGMDRISFVSEMGKYGSGIICMDDEELKREIAYAER
jgi:predicted HTH domain antitoxin